MPLSESDSDVRSRIVKCCDRNSEESNNNCHGQCTTELSRSFEPARKRLADLRRARRRFYICSDLLVESLNASPRIQVLVGSRSDLFCDDDWKADTTSVRLTLPGIVVAQFGGIIPVDIGEICH